VGHSFQRLRRRPFGSRSLKANPKRKDQYRLTYNCNRLAEDGETVTQSLPEPGVWTGMVSANALAPLRWKRAKIHRGSQQ
jgi:hypothetical protein